MTPLRKRMIDEMQLRNYCPKTVQVYVYNVARFARYFGKSPEVLGASHVRRYLLHVLQERKASWPTYKQELSALRFLYRYVLKRGDLLLDIRSPRSEQTLPVVLSLDEVRRFFAAIHSYKYRMILMTAYSAGLRISEVINLKVADIDSERMVIRVVYGKRRSSATPCCRRCCSRCCGTTGGPHGPWSTCSPVDPSTSPWRPVPCNASASRRDGRPDSTRRSRRTLCATALPPTYSKRGPTSAWSKSCWGIAVSARRSATPMSRHG